MPVFRPSGCDTGVRLPTTIRPGHPVAGAFPRCRSRVVAVRIPSKEQLMSDSSNILPELIEASRDGGEFYAEAAESVKDAELSKLFKRMARAKADLAQELANEV